MLLQTPNSSMPNATAAAAAAQHGAAGVGFSGAGFLILFYTGVAAVLQRVGVLLPETPVAGVSAGMITASLLCSGVPISEQLAANLALADRCRSSGACRGFLDSAVRAGLSDTLPADAAARCSGRLFGGVTQARPGSQRDTGVLLGPAWASRQKLIDAVAASSFLPGQSGGLVTTTLAPAIPAAYDGGFSNALPTPPGVS